MKSSEMSSPAQQPPKLVEDLDYYWEGGKMVLTAYFLKNRGYCCKNGCRHCPYGFNVSQVTGNGSNAATKLN